MGKLLEKLQLWVYGRGNNDYLCEKIFHYKKDGMSPKYIRKALKIGRFKYCLLDKLIVSRMK